MPETPEVSVVVTCYNYGHYVEGCLHSVLEQTYDNYEIIVIDDGSTDDTPQVMQKFSGLPNFHYVRQANAGQANAKNRGIQQARGRYIAFLDADDLWVKDKLQKQIRLFENPSVGVVYSRANLLDAEGRITAPGNWGDSLQPRSGWVTDCLFLDNFVWFSSSIVRKSCLEQYGRFDETLAMGIDWDLWLRLSTHYEFAFVDEPLLFYRMGHDGQMSKNIEKRFACSDRIMQRFLNKNRELINIKTVRKAYALTYCNRGKYYQKTNPWRSCLFFLKSLYVNPINRAAYFGLIRTIVRV